MLFDMGNGLTTWYDVSSGTMSEVITGALSGHDVDLSDGISVDGRKTVKIGNTVSSWRYYVWDGGWKDSTASFDPSSEFTSGSFAIAFYPEGISPVETPEYRSAWTMIRGNAMSTGYQTSSEPTGDGKVEWSYSYGNSNYVCATILVEGPHAYVLAGGGYTSAMHNPTLYCYDRFTGEELWSFEYGRGAGYETATGAIIGDRIYIPATEGILYSIPLSGDPDGIKQLQIPKILDHTIIGSPYATGAASLVYDSGVLYFGSSNGYVYCVDLDLNVIWKSEIGGFGYYASPTVYDGVVYYGALDGVLYAFDQVTGDLIDSVQVCSYEETNSKGEVKKYGSANPVVIVGDQIMLSFSDGKGMNSVYGGVASYRMTSTGFVEVFKTNDPGLSSSYVLPVETSDFKGVYGLNYHGLFRVSTDGKYEVLKEVDSKFKAPLVLINGDTLYASTYDLPGKILVFGLNGDVKGILDRPEDSDSYCMTAPVVIDGKIYNGTDGGAFAYSGLIAMYVSEDSSDSHMFLIILPVIIIIITLGFLISRARSEGIPFIAYIRSRTASSKDTDNASKVRRNKRRLLTVMVCGLLMTFVLFFVSLMYGPSGNYSFTEAISYFCSGLSKTVGGQELTNDEIFIFDSRGSRAVATVAVGIGLSISGSIYQAIIRNPMVDPYIMGVSAGAGVAAVATIAFNFTFFGILDNVTLATPIVAMVGGLIAFGATMLLAEKSGGASINYVLAGVIIGLVFSALQTLMLSMAGDKLNSAMSWLFGSFANIDWTQAILVFIPAVTLSLVPLVWAKEFNLVLLGEDQAKQMGLNVRSFNRWMLILASVLASVCVAFVGIVGFVGLVVPHLCRMILGGDHRLVMPASMVVGAALMLMADLFAKMIMAPMELPVGAITTVIGAPMFAYLLIKKGRMYDG